MEQTTLLGERKRGSCSYIRSKARYWTKAGLSRLSIGISRYCKKYGSTNVSTFPLVEHSVKNAALAAYREFSPEPDDLTIKELIDKGENNRVEFKVAAYWNAKLNRKEE